MHYRAHGKRKENPDSLKNQFKIAQFVTVASCLTSLHAKHKHLHRHSPVNFELQIELLFESQLRMGRISTLKKAAVGQMSQFYSHNC